MWPSLRFRHLPREHPLHLHLLPRRPLVRRLRLQLPRLPTSTTRTDDSERLLWIRGFPRKLTRDDTKDEYNRIVKLMASEWQIGCTLIPKGVSDHFGIKHADPSITQAIRDWFAAGGISWTDESDIQRLLRATPSETPRAHSSGNCGFHHL